jgi:hypothetical protein
LLGFNKARRLPEGRPHAILRILPRGGIIDRHDERVHDENGPEKPGVGDVRLDARIAFRIERQDDLFPVLAIQPFFVVGHDKMYR